ncbi:aminotransferase class I/II-fold pyridoxal phosphate-dependent enzyme [Trinickia dinghuensis]|uniref:Aminotransferase class I/II-fold pyridoxal phosphate-dependent enzyme n=1 Tax=Trinickia dinghuensis TaxID=2291023 RepID=A0A3D8K5H2_9BURK|nr:aminotransferase class I/II-fold pyridoxal phosphate-dependent enzyme [Trinickia dinghuensis]RDV00471.1 aminotransferase class I/II-fold pyridoxal phosphate-dependent enzyme [Trinickia dinghuensis]
MPKNLSTKLIHDDYFPPVGYQAVPPGVFKGSTVLFPDAVTVRERMRAFGRRDGYSYGLYGTPTTYILEQRLCALEGARHCLLGPSGQAAIALVNLGLLAAGDELLLPSNVYGPALRHARTTLPPLGITHQCYDPMDPADLERKLGPRTKLVWMEAPGSITMEFPDLRKLVAIAKENGVVVALDNTWGAGVAFKPFELGVDISIHALTKYPSGGADVLMGSVTTNDDALHERLRIAYLDLGMGVGANDVEFVLRGLPTLEARYHLHDASARSLATWMASQPAIGQVLHPALDSCPGHEHWASHCSLAAGLFSVLFKSGYASSQVDSFCDRLKLFGIGLSWGGPMSLVMPYDLPSIRSGKGCYEGHLVRFSIGLENTDDLREDLEQAMKASFGR